MTLILPFPEITGYIDRHYRQQIQLDSDSSNRVEAVYRKKILLFHVNITLEIMIVDVKPSSITLSYEAKRLVETGVNKILKYLSEMYPSFSQGVTLLPDQHVKIDLTKFPDLKPFTDNVALKDVSVVNDSLQIDSYLK